MAHDQPNRGTALDRALRDGEDFELILAVSPNDAAELLRTQPLRGLTGMQVLLSEIGEFVVELGLWSKTGGGEREVLSTKGFEH